MISSDRGAGLGHRTVKDGCFEWIAVTRANGKERLGLCVILQTPGPIQPHFLLPGNLWFLLRLSFQLVPLRLVPRGPFIPTFK